MINISDIKSLTNKKIYTTNNEKYVLTKDLEVVVHSPEYKILGFLNNYIYCRSGIYLTKTNMKGEEIASIKLILEHASFHEGSSYFYGFEDKTLYRINENMTVEWSVEFESIIKNIVADATGSVFVIFEDVNYIKKILSDGTELLQITGSEDITKTVRLQTCYVSRGGGWLYVIGTEYWDPDNKAQSFIDKYRIRTANKESRIIFKSARHISVDDPDFCYLNFYVSGDYYYIYSTNSITKINIKGVEYWNYLAGYNNISHKLDSMGYIEYSDNNFAEYLYFNEDLSSTNGHSFGKLTTSGKMLWKLTMEKSIESADFKFCTYNDKIYTTNKTLIEYLKSYVLSLNDNRLLFRTRDNHLIEILEYNKDELYSPDNYYGMYLEADTIKDGVEKIGTYPLLHDYGNVVDENNNAILVSSELDYYNNLDNYDYKRLVCSSYKVDATKFNILFAKMGKSLRTKLNSRLKTKQTYEDEKVYQYILNTGGKKIDTMQDKDLIRSRYEYAYNRYLLADKNMFFTNIVTKTLGSILITKKHGHRIVRKVRDIYKYLLSSYDDISLIEKWLEENDVDKTGLPKYVDELRHHTVEAIQDIQIAGTPNLHDIVPVKQFKYTFDGTEYPIRVWGEQIFSCTNLPFNKKKCIHKSFIDSLANLIEKELMRPVLFFLNGKAIPWSKCTIVKDWAYTYVCISNTNPYETDLQCVIFPCNIRYGEDGNILGDDVCNTHLYFNSDGLLDNTNIAIRVEVVDENIVGTTNDYSKKYVEVPNKYNQLASDQNILVFDQGRLITDAKYFITGYGKDIFTYNNPDMVSPIFKSFYWIKANSYYGNLYKIPNGATTQDYMIAETQSSSTHTEVDSFKTPFQFKLYRDKSYKTNIAQAVEYIMNYDMSLLVNFYKEESDIKTYIFSGKSLIDRVYKDGGWLVLPRVRKAGYTDYVMVFKNCKLYEWYSDIQYSANSIRIPIFNHVEREDIIEVIHFRKVDNNYYKFSVQSEYDPNYIDYLPEGLRYDNFELYANSPSGTKDYIDFNVESSVQFDIAYEYRNVFLDNGKYKGTEFKLADDYFMNKNINICSKRQFQYMYYNINKPKATVNLAPQFRFCHSKNHYMVFVNGKRLNFASWDLNLPVAEPLSKYISITFKKELQAGDKLDIFYIPIGYEEIFSATNETLTDDIARVRLTLDDLGYPFDKDLFMIFTNGTKINYEMINNINNHTIDVDIKKMKDIDDNYIYDTSNTCVLKFIQESELLGKIFSYSDHWSNAVDSLTNEQYLKLLETTTKK